MRWVISGTLVNSSEFFRIGKNISASKFIDPKILGLRYPFENPEMVHVFIVFGYFFKL